MPSALFSLADIAAQAAPRPIGQPAAVVRRGEMPLSLAALAPGRRELREHVGDLRDRELVQFATGGRWSACKSRCAGLIRLVQQADPSGAKGKLMSYARFSRRLVHQPVSGLAARHH